MPPDVDHLLVSVLLGCKDALISVALVLSVTWSLVPVGLGVGEVELSRSNVQVSGPDDRLLGVERVNIRVEVLVPGILLRKSLQGTGYSEARKPVNNERTLRPVPAFVTYVPTTYTLSNSNVTIRPFTCSASG